jgi:hypothetical protein
MDSSDSDSPIPKALVRCVCTRRCGGPGKGKLITVRSRQRHALRKPKELPVSFMALRMQPSNAPPAAGVAASGMGPTNVDLIDHDPVGTGAGGTLHEVGEGVFNDMVRYTAVISEDLCLFHIGYARS